MCLTIDSAMHPDGKPLIAGYDMLVWKWLAEGFRSPVQEMCWTPGVEVRRAIRHEPGCPSQIGPGLHCDPSGTDVWYGCVAYPAIIPKGAKFYIGPGPDVATNIVANRMTVYRTLDDALQGRTLGKADLSQHKAAP